MRFTKFLDHQKDVICLAAQRNLQENRIDGCLQQNYLKNLYIFGRCRLLMCSLDLSFSILLLSSNLLQRIKCCTRSRRHRWACHFSLSLSLILRSFHYLFYSCVHSFQSIAVNEVCCFNWITSALFHWFFFRLVSFIFIFE